MVNDLYPSTFPIDVRHFLADWIEQQIWEDFEPGKTELESRAKYQLDQVINLLQMISEQNSSIVDKMKLRQISKTLGVYFQPRPLDFGVLVRDILRKEQYLLSNCPQISCSQYAPKPTAPEITMDQLVNKVLEIQDIRQKIHVLKEELNLDQERFEAMGSQGSVMQNGRDLSSEDPQKNLRICIEQKKYNLESMALTRVHLLQECVQRLEQYQHDHIFKLERWCYEQHKSAIGHPFDDNLLPLQNGFEQFLEMNAKLRQEVFLVGDPATVGLTEKLTSLLTDLVQSSLVIEKQPPQVIKTQSKFSASVRYLFGDKIAPGKAAMLKVQIINEQQARGLRQGGLPSDNVGELMNNTAILEHNTTTKSTSAAFRNMSIRKIKRAERKGSECVTEEKFALLFSGEIHITGWDYPYSIHAISVPIVVIVHGSQDINAMATVLWDCAFAEPNREPFVVPERVPWRQMCNMLNVKFTSEVNTRHSLNEYNLLFLAQKIFDKHDICDFSNMFVSWSQFNKETLPGRSFTFWQWFEGVMELTKKHIQSYWSDKLIFGFIGKQHLHVILKDSPGGTFLLRFSDSEIGAITIAYVEMSENGARVQNIMPFNKKALEISGLGNRIIDLKYLTYLYPNILKTVFNKYYNGPEKAANPGYIQVQLVTVPQPSDMNGSSNQNMMRPSPTLSSPEPYSLDPNPVQILPYPVTDPLYTEAIDEFLNEIKMDDSTQH
uniref:Signal transducer and activator of transcription n=1 Tax=Knipowitschia caucasica TaxID=637954 RepID=A0AAV2LYN6_KNICA